MWIWRKSSFSAGGNCVEVGWRKSRFSTVGDCVEVAEGTRVRNSRYPERGELVLESGALAQWIRGVREGEFDPE